MKPILYKNSYQTPPPLIQEAKIKPIEEEEKKKKVLKNQEGKGKKTTRNEYANGQKQCNAKANPLNSIPLPKNCPPLDPTPSMLQNVNHNGRKSRCSLNLLADPASLLRSSYGPYRSEPPQPFQLL
jgi:hypothetical protein